MALPSKLERFVEKVTTRTDVESRLLPGAVERLNNSLRSLRKVGGDSIQASFEQLIACALGAGGSSDCFDQFEDAVDEAVTAAVGRDLTEAEEALIEALVKDVECITEALLAIGGVELVDTEDESGDESGEEN